MSPPSASHTGPFVVNVTSTQNITLVAMRNGTSFGSYTVYPIANAGRFYQVVSFPSANENQQAEVIVIGVDDQPAEITFKSRVNFSVAANSSKQSFHTVTHLNADNKTMVFTISGLLAKSEMIVFRSNDDLKSSTVTADINGGRIAVISNSYCPNQPCDLLMEQIPPIQTFGSTYFLVPAKNYGGVNTFRIVPLFDNTTVNTNSLQAMDGEPNSETYVMSRGDFYDLDLDRTIVETTSLKATKPVIVMHYLIKNTEPPIVSSVTIIPSVEQYTYGNSTFSTYNVTTSRNPASIIRNYVNIITECDQKNKVLFDNKIIEVWKVCPPLTGGSLYCATQKQMATDGRHTLRSENADAKFAAIQYGIRTDNSAFANSLFMNFEEITCDVEEGGNPIPCSKPTPTTQVLPTTMTLPTTLEATDNMTTLNPYAPPTNATHSKTTSRREKAGTGELNFLLKHFPKSTTML